MQFEIIDNFATQKDLNDKDGKIKAVKTTEPKNNELKDGDRVFYYDGTNYYKYYKAGGILLKQQLTKA